MRQLIDRNIAIALLNNDLDCLTSEEIKKIDLEFNCDFTVTDWLESDGNDINGVCAITGLYSDCVEVETE